MKDELVPRLQELWKGSQLGPDPVPARVCVHVSAQFWAGPGVEPDLSGAMETVGDILQESRVIENDRWIKSWDGSRVHTTDKKDPRTEVVLETMIWEPTA